MISRYLRYAVEVLAILAVVWLTWQAILHGWLP